MIIYLIINKKWNYKFYLFVIIESLNLSKEQFINLNSLKNKIDEYNSKSAI